MGKTSYLINMQSGFNKNLCMEERTLHVPTKNATSHPNEEFYNLRLNDLMSITNATGGLKNEIHL
jgi:hypothetical protein